MNFLIIFFTPFPNRIFVSILGIFHKLSNLIVFLSHTFSFVLLVFSFALAFYHLIWLFKNVCVINLSIFSFARMCAQPCPTLCDPIDSYQAPLSMEFSRQEYWSTLSFPTPRISLTQRLNPCLLCILHWQVDSFPLSHLGSPSFPLDSSNII